jgi:hypothetical protein
MSLQPEEEETAAVLCSPRRPAKRLTFKYHDASSKRRLTAGVAIF